MSTEDQIRDSLAEQMARQMGITPDEAIELDDEVSAAIEKELSAVPALQQGEKAYDFSEEFQTKITTLVIRDEVFYRRVEGLVRPEYFENQAEAALVHIATHYYERYRRLPDLSDWIELVRDAQKRKVIREDDKPELVARLKEILKAPVNGREYAVDRVAEFAKRQAVSRALYESAGMIDAGQMEKAEQMVKKAFATGAKSAAEQIDYWNSVEQRTQYRRDKEAGLIKPDGITTGMSKLDSLLYHRGWGRKELSVVMGAAKKGKSTGLLHFALAASLAGYNVLYVTLEVASRIITERMDANISGVDMGELSLKANEVERGVKDRSAIRKPGALKVIEYPSGSMTCTMLRRDLESFRADGIQFDLIVVDYADIMAAEFRSGNDISESKQVWLGLRAIASEENAAVLTATQTNRDGFRADVATADTVAEDFNKIRIADLVLSINRTEEERAKGEARLFFAASRNQQGEFTLRISQDMGKMRFMTAIMEIS